MIFGSDTIRTSDRRVRMLHALLVSSARNRLDVVAQQRSQAEQAERSFGLVHRTSDRLLRRTPEGSQERRHKLGRLVQRLPLRLRVGKAADSERRRRTASSAWRDAMSGPVLPRPETYLCRELLAG